MNAWYPGWRRNWWRVRREIMSVASGLVVNGELLSDCLFIPWTADPDDQDERDLLGLFDARLASPAAGLVLGELSSLERARRGWVLSVKASQRRIFVSDQAHAALQRRFPRAVSAMNGTVPWGGSLVGLLQVERSRQGDGWRLTGAHLSLGDARWIPCHSQREMKLADLLMQAGRGFVRHLSGDAPADRAAATAADFYVVSDTRPAVAVWALTDTGAIGRRREALIRAEAQAAGLRLLVWAEGGPLPEIPPARQRDRMASA